MNEIPYTSPEDGENCCTVNAQLALGPPTHLASRSQVAMLQRRVQACRGRGWPTSPLTCIAPLRFHILRLHKSQERDRDRLGSPHPCSGPQRTSHSSPAWLSTGVLSQPLLLCFLSSCSQLGFPFTSVRFGSGHGKANTNLDNETG